MNLAPEDPKVSVNRPPKVGELLVRYAFLLTFLKLPFLSIIFG